MRPWQKLAAYALVLAVALAGGAALGSVVGPIDTGSDDPVQTHDDSPNEDDDGLHSS